MIRRRCNLVAVPVVADDGQARHRGADLFQDVFIPRFFSTVQRVVISTLLALALRSSPRLAVRSPHRGL
jgi:hypothetical protein